MEPLDHKALERMVSQKAVEMGNSYPCKVCVVGFLCGLCLTSLFLATLSSFGVLQLDGISFSSAISTLDSSSKYADVETIRGNDEDVQILYYDWSKMLNKSIFSEVQLSRKKNILGGSNTLKAPHLENCKTRTELNHHLDTRVQNEKFPPWTIWKGTLNKFPLSSSNHQQLIYSRHPLSSDGYYPPWVTGSDEENYPLTRKAQSDIWLHQHPSNCSHPKTRFLIADWERLPGFGIGAQIAGMTGLLSIAIKEKRVLVTSYYNRADHNGCKGSFRSSWSCYFLSETSQECRERALELMQRKDSWEKGIVSGKENYTSKEIWAGRAPRVWGDPWSYMQPTTLINGSLIASHRKMDRRWWRAQAVRYLMRFRSEYTCHLLNVAKHEAFGLEAAKMVLANPSANLTEKDEKRSDMEKYVWSNHKAWMPHPLLSMHVRMGDKSCEMEVFGFEKYMNLAQTIRNHFPHLNTIWLSTEMQEVIDKTKLYPNWRFYYTNVSRQEGNITMASYEARLGRETSTNYPLVNFLMATESDFFIGALGSTWCYLIDGMRNTGGKVMSGYLSVNKDRFW